MPVSGMKVNAILHFSRTQCEEDIIMWSRCRIISQISKNSKTLNSLEVVIFCQQVSNHDKVLYKVHTYLTHKHKDMYAHITLTVFAYW
jgi:hypothetical protein